MPNFRSFVYDMAARFKPEVVDGFCYGKFRPSANYGTIIAPFGFDWVRTGDATAYTQVDIPYKKNVGHYTNYRFPPLKCLQEADGFSPSRLMYNKLCKSYEPGNLTLFPSEKGGFKRYHVPVLSLYVYNDQPDNIASLVLEIEIKKGISEMRLDYASALFEIEGFDSSQLSEGKHICPLQIKCIKEFDRDEYIKLIATDSGGKRINAGMLRVVPNAKRFRKSVNILFVNVRYVLSKKPDAAVLAGHAQEDKQGILNIFKHALIMPEFETIDLDLQHDRNMVNRTIKMGGNEVITAYYQKTGRLGNKVPVPGTCDLEDYLAEKLQERKDLTAYHSVVFCMGSPLVKEEDSIIDPINGYADGKYAVLIKDYEPATAAHEILHTLGLNHSFSNHLLKSNSSSPYVYRKFTTDNMMDYSHVKGYDRTRLWEWQWKMIRQKCNPAIE